MSKNSEFVKFDKVDKSYDGKVLVVKDLNLDIAEGEFITMLGPSGSGKTTCLMMLAGFETPTNGEIYLDKNPISNIPPHKRGIGMVFQNYALFPHMTVYENLAFPLRVRKISKEDIDKKVDKALSMVSLSGFENRMPGQLSGGQQQRVGLARALATNTDIMLMDEAFSALDPLIRSDMQKQLMDLQSELKKTIVFITHDLDESLRLGDHIGILNGGKLVQVGTPVDIIMNPADDYVTAFVKDVNRAKVIKAKIIMKPVSEANGVDKTNLVKVQEDQFIEEFLPQVVCNKANCEVIDKQGNVKGYITNKELQKSLTKS